MEQNKLDRLLSNEIDQSNMIKSYEKSLKTFQDQVLSIKQTTDRIKTKWTHAEGVNIEQKVKNQMFKIKTSNNALE